MKISLDKLKQLFIISMLIIVEVVITTYVKANETAIGADQALIMVSWLCDIALIIMIISWKKLTKEVLCPYIVFLLVLFVFTCGQAIGWSLGLDMGGKDMWDRVDHGINRLILQHGLSYSLIGVTSFHLGAIVAYSNKSVKESIWDAEKVTQSYKSLGKLMLIIAVPAFFAQATSDILAVISGGYANFYEVNDNAGLLMDAVNILSDWYLPCLLILLIAYRNSPKHRTCIVAGMLAQVVVPLFVGGRSGAVMTMLGVLLAYHYFVKPFNKKTILTTGAIGYVGIAGLNAIATFRNMSDRGIGDLITLTISSFGNAIGEMLGELGWTITSICWTMELVPSSYPFRYGMSYLVSLISWVPSFVFGGRDNHPVVIWAHLAAWLQDALHKSYGPGYSMVAEAFINFGYWGHIALAIEGYIIARVIARIPRRSVESNLVGSTFQILVIMTIMKSLVRSSVSVAFREVAFVLIPLYVIIYFTTKRKRE